ncbi:MAG: hypothetical protein ACK5MP_07465 [Nostocoides sp.]
MEPKEPIPQARIERYLAESDFMNRLIGHETTETDREAARRVLTGEATAEQIIAEGLAELEAKYGFTR